MKRLVILGLVLSFLACSKTQPQTQNNPNPPQGNNSSFLIEYLGDGGIKSVSRKIDARGSWQDFGVSVRKGDQVLIKPSGTWTGGQIKIGSDSSNTEIRYCGAEGCNGDQMISYNDPEFTMGEIILAGGGDPDTVIHDIFYTVSNIDRNAGHSFDEIMQGYLAGRLDGKTICFSANNVLLGANTSNLPTDGHWRNRKVFWEARAAAQTMNPTVHDLLLDMADIYKDATCTQPVSLSAIENKLNQLRNADYFYAGPEIVYDVVYSVQVPQTNYKKACNSEGDIVLSYLYGKPHQVIRKNECAQTDKNALVMKIVPPNVEFDDAAPIIVQNDYKETAYTVPETGRVYFRNNDLDLGLHDNYGHLDVIMSLQ